MGKSSLKTITVERSEFFNFILIMKFYEDGKCSSMDFVSSEELENQGGE